MNMCTNLEIGVPPSATMDFGRYICARRDNHLIPKLSYACNTFWKNLLMVSPDLLKVRSMTLNLSLCPTTCKNMA